MVGIGRLRSDACAYCGSDQVEVTHYSDEVDYKSLSFCVAGLVKTVCKHCNKSWETTGQNSDNNALIKEAYAIKRDEVRANDGLLTSGEIAKIVESLGMSKADAARIFGGGPNAFGKYLSGEVLQSFAMDRLLRLTYAYGRSAVAVLEMSGALPGSSGYALQQAWVAHSDMTKAKSIYGPSATVPNVPSKAASTSYVVVLNR